MKVGRCVVSRVFGEKRDIEKGGGERCCDYLAACAWRSTQEEDDQ